MGIVTVEQALKKGKIQLVWMPLGLFLGMLTGGVATFLVPPFDYQVIVGASLILGAFVVPWIWWSFKVVHWKIWAFANVADVKTLEKRAIAMQLIWPHGSWFEKTEIKTKQEAQVIEYLYNKIATSSSSRESVVDSSLPEQMTITYPRSTIYINLFIAAVALYMLYIKSYFIGAMGILLCVYNIYDHIKKIKNVPFFMKLDVNGITLPKAFIPWDTISHYYIERDGYGESTRFTLIIESSNRREEIVLTDININAFTIERYLDVYRTRHEQKHAR